MDRAIRRTKPEKTGVSAPLGDLEQAVMRHVWASGQEGILAGDVQAEVDKVHPVAITTILTTLDRLREKGIVSREREGKAYRYWALSTEDELQRRIVGGVLDRLIAQFPKAVAAYFSKQAGDGDDAEKAHLKALARYLENAETESHSPSPTEGDSNSESVDGH